MAEYVRVRDKETGHHVSILRSQYDRNPDVWQELKRPAAHADGTPVRVKHKTSVSTETAKSTTPSGQTADTEKE